MKVMMMENKYYTPELEEFHVGFEYELRVTNEWQQCEWSPRNDMSWFNLELIDRNGEEKFSTPANLIRVKYLDQEDIEELGWEEDLDAPCRYELKGYILYKFREDGFITIKRSFTYEKYGTSFIGFDILFEGTIKNKSELKKVMIMLGI